MHFDKDIIEKEITQLKSEIDDNLNAEIPSKKLKAKQLTRLEELNKKLKQINNIEKEKTRRINDIFRVGSQNDSLAFAIAKKKKDADGMNVAKEAKKLRQVAMEVYNKYIESEKVYYQIDPEEFPAYLFFHKEILSKYGLCESIDIDINIDVSEYLNKKNEIKTKRQEWLENTCDQGEIYKELYNEFVEQKPLNDIVVERDNTKQSLLNFIKEHILEEEYNRFQNAYEFLIEYKSVNIKTKKLKEKYKHCINELSLLVAETGFKLHEFICIDLDIYINVNEITETKKKDPFLMIYLLDEYAKYLQSLRELIEKTNNTRKYNSNIVKNLKNDLYTYFTDKGKFLETCNEMSYKFNVKKQTGKYFKRWIMLSEEEKLERFESFANHYINTTSTFAKMDGNDKRIIVVQDLLKEAHTSKKMIYRDFKWVSNLGIIEKVKILLYNKDTDTFRLKYSKKESNNTQTKKISIRTLISKENEKIINEDLLYFILNNKNSNSEESKELFIENLKSKFKVKKIVKNDKAIIFEKYDNIYQIINQNKN